MSTRTRARRKRSDFDKAMGMWAAKDAYQAQTGLELIAVVVAFGALLYVLSVVGTWLGY